MSAATSRRATLPIWLGALVALLALLGWTRALWSGYLILGAALFLTLVVWTRLHGRLLAPAPRRWVHAGTAVLGLGLLVAGVAHWRFELIEFRWDQLSAAREEQLARQLTRRMAEVEKGGQEAVRLAAAAVSGATRSQAFRRLAEIRERLEVDAMVLLDESGDPRAWTGEHHGPIPDTLSVGPARTHFEERPLFSYLYFVEPVPGAGRVVAAVLIETGLGDPGGDLLTGLFASPVDARVSFHTGHPGVSGRTVWVHTEGADTTVQARLRPLTQRERRAEVERVPRRAGVLLAGLSFALFVLAFLLSRGGGRAATYAPLLALLPLLSVAPLGEVFGIQNIFSPGFFLLRSGDLTLGRVLALLVPIAALVAAIRRPSLSPRHLPLVLGSGALAVALAYPGGLYVMIAGATRTLLESGMPLWIGLQLACVLLLAIITGLALPRVHAAGRPPSPRVLLALRIAGVLLAAALAVMASSYNGRVTTRYALLWAVPFVLVAAGVAWEGGRRGAVRRWLLAGWLAVTAVLPHLWTAHVQARLATAETELSRLGSQPDPYLEYLLRSFGQEALARYYTGETGVQLLYRTWVASGLAREGYEARITLWAPGNVVEAQLGLIEELTTDEGRVLLELLDDSRVQGVPDVSPFTDQPHMSQVLTLPLADGDVISVIVPPRRTLGRGTGLSFFFGGAPTGSSVRLNLVPSQSVGSPDREVVWQRAGGGWRTEAEVQYPDGRYYAHLLVPVPGRGVWLARAALLITLDMALLLALWALGVLARGGSPLPPGSWSSWLGSFRARITVSLLAFFLLPTVVFGYVAYRALAQEVERATGIVAARAAAQAVSEFPSRLGDLRVLAQHAGTDVLRYVGGELLGASAPEALELGVYNAWMPPDAYAQLENGQERAVQHIESFGNQRYVMAFQALVPSGALAVPMPLVSTDIAVRQRELAHLIAFAAVLGALLSIALSIAVGRALAGPLGLLRRASAAVGAGRVRVQLPENQPGEFGQVFASFNRMVRRLRRARARELRSARVLAWGEMARQVAHEIKNPLTPIKLSIQHLRRAYQDRAPGFDRVLERSVHEILREIDRLSEIARVFSRYGAPAFSAGPLEAVDAGAMIEEALTLYRTGDEGVQYESVVDAGIPRVQARAGELKEVLLNLIENARAALDGGGRVVVRALAHDERIELEVEDDGSGIPEDMIGRVFDPHFSTRSTGTGLGLAIVRRLVESWGGTVGVDSRPGAGTTVRLRLLPAAAAAAPPHYGTR